MSQDKRKALHDVPKPKEDKLALFYGGHQAHTAPGNQDDKTTSRHVNIRTDVQADKASYRRQTYYLTDDLIERLRIYAFCNRSDKSEVTRAALDAYLPSLAELSEQIGAGDQEDRDPTDAE